MIMGWGRRVRGLFADTKGPWGPAGKGEGDEPSQADSSGDKNGPWGEPPRRIRRPTFGGSNISSLDELIRRSRARFGGGGGGDGGLQSEPSRSLILWAILGLVLIWLVFTSTRALSWIWACI